MKLTLRAFGLATLAATAAGDDLRLTYRCPADGSEQAYRLYLPTGYQAGQPVPLVIALHGSGGNENSFFDDEARYPSEHGLKAAAEQHQVLVACPSARGNTNYRGLGEVAVFSVLADLQRRYRIDPDRIYLTGHSMGGTGATDLALHHPGVFAAVVPLAAARSIRWVAANAGHTPFWWIGGALDQEYYKLGVVVGYERMKRLGCPVEFTELAGEGHYGTARDFRPVLNWLMKQRRSAHPRAFTFEIDTALHPRAYWVTVDRLAEPGKIAAVRARALSASHARVDVEQVAALSVWPDPAIFTTEAPWRLDVGEATVFIGEVPRGHAVVLTRDAERWKAQTAPHRELPHVAYRTHPIATATEMLDHSGVESRLGNWIADAMRAAADADLALYNHRLTDADRPIPAGQVDIVDLLQCSLPGDQDLVTVELLGRDVIEILEANIPVRDGPAGPAANLLVQISGASYSFDRGRPVGQRIVDSTLQPEKRYVVVLEGQVVERETMRLAGRFKQLRYTTTEIPFTVALYAHAARSSKLIAPREGRVREVK
jgi:predicted esterase